MFSLKTVLATSVLFTSLVVFHLLTGDGIGVKLRVTLSRITEVPCVPPSSLMPPFILTVCSVIGEDNFSSVLEWIAFHMAQGVQRFDIVYDIRSPFNISTYNRLIHILDPYIKEGIVYTHKRDDALSWIEKLDLSRKSARHKNARACGPTEEDIAALKSMYNESVFVSNTSAFSWTFQRVFNALCLGEAKLRGDAWLGIFDGDEYIFQPGRAGLAEECFYGGRPQGEEPGTQAAQEVDARRGSSELSATACQVPLEEAPLLSERSVVSVLKSHYDLWSSVSVRGVAFGLNDDGAPSRQGLVIGTHTRTAKYDQWGFQVGPPGKEYLACPPDFCGKAAPHKSFIRVNNAPLSGVQNHMHQVGLMKTYFPGRGAPLKLNHYHADDLNTVRFKAVTTESYSSIVENRGGMTNYLRSWPDSSGKALTKVTHFCMNLTHIKNEICWLPP